MKNLAILGAGGHGKVLADIAVLLGWSKVFFFDDSWPSRENNGCWPIVGNTADLLSRLSDFDGVVVGVGDNCVRLKKQEFLISHGAPIVNLIHPAAHMSPFASVGIGSVVMAKAVINVDSKIGDACIINTGAIIDHDCELKDGVHISPNATLAGGVKVGLGAWVGIGASVRQLVAVGDGAIIGAGAVVLKDVPALVTLVGNPARVIGKV